MMIGAMELPTLRDYQQKRKLTVCFLDMCKKVWYCCVLERSELYVSSTNECQSRIGDNEALQSQSATSFSAV